MPRNRKSKFSKPGGSPFQEQNGSSAVDSTSAINCNEEKHQHSVRFFEAEGGKSSGIFNAGLVRNFWRKKGKKSVDTQDHSKNKSNYYLPPAGRPLRPVPSMGTLHRLDRQKIVLWKQPIRTLYYCFLELLLRLKEYSIKLWNYRRSAVISFIVVAVLFTGYRMPGPHQKVIKYFEKKLLWSAYWVGLGILSSVGFGTGLHTFLLYLGPHIASVTLAAYECDSLKFPEPPYPDEIICPFDSSYSNGNESVGAAASTVASGLATTAVSLWAIMSKVRLEAFMWGAGTALGELPPYFMARAARLSGEEPDDEEYREFLDFLRVQEEREGITGRQGWMDRAKLVMEKLVESVGFFGILICASIPNPLFDLAGITCGHFLVPFWTFFGATLIGKAVVKMHIQKLFVIMTFSERHVEKMVHLIKYIPKIGPSLQTPFKEYLKQQKEKLHHRPGDRIKTRTSWLQMVFDLFLVLMVIGFILSIVNSLAQSYHKRLCVKEKDKVKKKRL